MHEAHCCNLYCECASHRDAAPGVDAISVTETQRLTWHGTGGGFTITSEPSLNVSVFGTDELCEGTAILFDVCQLSSHIEEKSASSMCGTLRASFPWEPEVRDQGRNHCVEHSRGMPGEPPSLSVCTQEVQI
eukprot:scaffold67402_cov15-Tisochrysis_lutea.AAC.1